MRYIICGADLADMQHLIEFKKILVLIACFFVFFSVRVFLHRHWWFTGQQGREGTNVYSTLPLPPAHEHLIATLYVRWLSRFLNRNACVYQTATRWDLTPYWITIWLIDWWCNVYLSNWGIDFRFFFTEILTLETCGLQLASTITLVLQANQLIDT